MPTDIRLWKIEDDHPVQVQQKKLEIESRLEKWIIQDITLVSNDLLVISQQFSTQHGGIIDVLALDHEGNIVILELKRAKTPRDIVAQLLDYSASLDGMSSQEIQDIANRFYEKTNSTLDDAFERKFHTELPDVLNGRCRMYILASEIDSSSERIVKYLSEKYGVDINIATFAYFQVGGLEFVGNTLLLDEEEVETRSEMSSRRRAKRSWEDFEAFAEKQGIGDLYKSALSLLRPLFDSATRTLSNVSLIGYMGENKSRCGIISIFPGVSSPDFGLAIGIRMKYFLDYFMATDVELNDVLGAPDGRVKDLIDPLVVSGRYWGTTYALDAARLERLVAFLNAKKHGT